MPKNLIDGKHQTFHFWQEPIYITSWLIFIGKLSRLRRSQRNVLENWFSVCQILIEWWHSSWSCWESFLAPDPQLSAWRAEKWSPSLMHSVPHISLPLISSFAFSASPFPPRPPEQWRRGDCPAPQWRYILQPDGIKAWGGIYCQCGGSERASPEPPYLGQRLHWWVPPTFHPMATH